MLAQAEVLLDFEDRDFGCAAAEIVEMVEEDVQLV